MTQAQAGGVTGEGIENDNQFSWQGTFAKGKVQMTKSVKSEEGSEEQLFSGQLIEAGHIIAGTWSYASSSKPEGDFRFTRKSVAY